MKCVDLGNVNRKDAKAAEGRGGDGVEAKRGGAESAEEDAEGNVL